MNSEIKIFKHPEFGSIRVTEQNGEPWFVAKDIAERLGYSNTRDAVSKHVDPEDAKRDGVVTRDAIGRDQIHAIINESGLYSLVLSSKLPNAKKFKRWVTSEVLPAIRRTGGYIAAKEDDTPEEIMARALLIANETIQRQKEHIEWANAKIEQDKPKVLFADSVSASDSTILVGELAKLCKQNGVDIGQTRMFEWLRNNGYLMQTGSSRNLPTQRSMEMGLFTIKETTVVHADGHTTVNRTPKVTGKGQVYFVNKIMSKEGKHEKESRKAN